MSNFIYPRFSDEKEFELFVNDIFKRKTKNINFQIYGRKGQKQYGIDGYGFDYIHNDFIVTQCKNYNSDKESEGKFINDLSAALNKFDDDKLPFKEKVNKFYYVTSASRDIKPSNTEEGELNNDRIAKGLIPFKILTWDDLCDELENHQDLLYKFFLKHIPLDKIKNINYNLKSIENTTILKFGDSISDEQVELFKSSFIEKINIEITFNNKEDNESTLILGLHGYSSKPNFNGKVDLDLDFSQIYFGDSDGLDNFLSIVTTIINDLHSQIGLQKIIIKSHIQPCLATYIGKFFKNLTSGIEFITWIISTNLFLSSKSEYLLYSDPGISEKRLYFKEDGDVNNLALFYNVSQSTLQIEDELSKKTFEKINPRYGFYLEGNRITNSSHGFSQIKYVADKIKTLANEYRNGSSRLSIHIVLICPEQIAFIIGASIERINADIYLYYQSEDSTDYILFDKLN